LNDDGGVVEEASIADIRAQFYKTYPTKGEAAKAAEAQRKAFNRQLKRARKAGLICTRKIGGEEYIGISTLTAPA
jgi:hypothetical protein